MSWWGRLQTSHLLQLGQTAHSHTSEWKVEPVVIKSRRSSREAAMLTALEGVHVEWRSTVGSLLVTTMSWVLWMTYRILERSGDGRLQFRGPTNLPGCTSLESISAEWCVCPQEGSQFRMPVVHSPALCSLDANRRGPRSPQNEHSQLQWRALRAQLGTPGPEAPPCSLTLLVISIQVSKVTWPKLYSKLVVGI